MTPHYWRLFSSLFTDLLLLPPLTGLGKDSGEVQSLVKILNRYKSKALVVSKCRTVNPPHSDLVLSGVSIRASPNLGILDVKFDSKLTFQDHVRDITSRISQRIGILKLVKRIFVDMCTSVLLRCYYSYVLQMTEYCTTVWGSAAECHFQLLVRQVYSVASHYPDHSFFSLCYRRHVAGLWMLYKVTVCSANFHPLLQELDILELRQQLIHWRLKYQGIERPKLHSVSRRARFEYGMIFPILCLTPECWIGSMMRTTVDCLRELCFLQFSVVHVLVGLRKLFINNLVFFTFAYAAGFNNNNNYNNDDNNVSPVPTSLIDLTVLKVFNM